MVSLSRSLVICASVSFFALLLLYPVALVWFRPVTTSSRREATAKVRQDRELVLSVVLLYASDTDGRIPAFKSDRLPRWWKDYTGTRHLQTKILFEVPVKYVGKKSVDVMGKHDLIVEERR